MKKVRKLICLALAMVMALAMCVTAYATEPAAATGTITVDNASKGESYTLVKLFDATYNDTKKAIVYKLVDGENDVPTGLKDYFELNPQGGIKYVIAKDEAQEKNAENKATGNLSSAAVGAITAWAKAVTSGVHFVETKTADGGALTFTGLAHGYYVVVSRSSSTPGGVVSVTSLGPNQNIQDKSTSDNPHFPEDGTGKKINGGKLDTVAVGDEVTYTVTYHTVNWINVDKTANDGAETKVTKYVVKDTLPKFLESVTVSDVTVKEGNKDAVSIKNTITGIENFGTAKTFDIPWVDKEGKSLYVNGAVLTITYTAIVTKDILTSDAAAENHTNEITITPNNEQPGDDDKTTADVYTGRIVVKKYAAKADGITADETEALADAKFVLADHKVDPTDGTAVKYAQIDKTTGKVTWVIDKAQATTITTDDKGEATFEGLDDGTYYLEETEAPAGYNKLNERQEVTVGAATTKNKTNITQTATVVNKTGTQLPSTGGIGTTIFYVVGSILMLGAVVLFVTRKRSSER